VTIHGVAPAATFTRPGTVPEGSPFTLRLADPSDPSSADAAAGLAYAFDCGGGSGAFGPDDHVSCPTDDNEIRDVGARIRDAGGEMSEYTGTITVENVAPTATLAAPAEVEEGSAIAVSLTNGDDVSSADRAAGFTFVFDCGGGFGDPGPSASTSCPTADDGSLTVRGRITDKDGGSRTYERRVTIGAVAPSATLTAPGAHVPEGTAFSIGLTDPSDPSSADRAAGFSYAFDCGGGFGAYGTATARTCPTDDNATRAVAARIRDAGGASREYTSQVVVDNLDPSIPSMSGPIDPLRLGAAATVTLRYADPGSADTHSVRFAWDDGTTTTIAGTSGSATATRTYAASGVYSVDVLVTDDDGGRAQGSFQFVVVYDPSSGFVTGGGWIDSPAGAYRPAPTLTGRANFGFTSQYKKGATIPTGETEFQFHAGGVNFHSTAYEWLVVSGPKAQYKGTGTLNGATGYRFLLTATDGQVAGGGGSDRFRIKLTHATSGALVYDNVPGASEDIDLAAPQALGGGNIFIKK
jgi:hypothetical protein